jgi:hypothetical protein
MFRKAFISPFSQASKFPGRRRKHSQGTATAPTQPHLIVLRTNTQTRRAKITTTRKGKTQHKNKLTKEEERIIDIRR